MNYDQGVRTAKELLSRLMKEESLSISKKAPGSKERPTRPSHTGSMQSIPDSHKAKSAQTAEGPRRQPTTKTFVLYAGIATFVLLVLIGGSRFLGGIFSFMRQPPTATGMPTQKIEPTHAASATVAPDTPSPEPPGFYTEEFDANLDAWTFFMKSGQESGEFSYVPADGKLVVHISPEGDKPWAYLVNKTFNYTDVQLEAVTINTGNNSNGVSLVCRYGSHGWYEFWISNNGKYAIYAFGPDGSIPQGGNLLAEGGSSEIHTGKSENIYTAVCKDSDLSLAINGKQVQIVKARYDFTEGNIGIGFSALLNNPIDLEIASLKISQP
jgi:hypothetical protein